MKNFQVFAYVFLIIVGAWMFGFTVDGHIIVICIACNSFITNILAIVSIITGVVGLSQTVFNKRELNSNIKR